MLQTQQGVGDIITAISRDILKFLELVKKESCHSVSGKLLLSFERITTNVICIIPYHRRVL
jgi:hypothetical protein